MAKRQIITIDEEKCNGCGDCITACSEGALRLVNGKAKLVTDKFCDGFGDCIGECPTGALKIVEREAEDFDFNATALHVANTMGLEGVAQLEAAHRKHMNQAHVKNMTTDKEPVGEMVQLKGGHAHGGGCPGSMQRVLPSAARPAASISGGGPAKVIPSELAQWPIQIHLVRPDAPFFKNKELVVMNTCGPIASPDVHWRFIRGRSIVVGCPKLDDTAPYVEKLASILSESTIPRVIVVRMEVPCCGGLTAIVREAAAACGRTDLEVQEATLSLQGDLLRTNTIAH